MAYFANSTEGSVLDQQCAQCPIAVGARDPNTSDMFEDEPRELLPCPVHAAHMVFNYDQLGDGQEKLRECLTMLVDERGKCGMRAALVRAGLANEL